jgi:hypothetical protein
LIAEDAEEESGMLMGMGIIDELIQESVLFSSVFHGTDERTVSFPYKMVTGYWFASTELFLTD